MKIYYKPERKIYILPHKIRMSICIKPVPSKGIYEAVDEPGKIALTWKIENNIAIPAIVIPGNWINMALFPAWHTYKPHEFLFKLYIDRSKLNGILASYKNRITGIVPVEHIKESNTAIIYCTYLNTTDGYKLTRDAETNKQTVTNPTNELIKIEQYRFDNIIETNGIIQNDSENPNNPYNKL